MHEKFELRRQIDGLVHVFERCAGFGTAAVYERSDQMVRVIHDARFGWSTWNSDDGSLSGRVWDTLPEEQGDFPTEGTWVSRKGAKSYVYELVYVVG